MSLDVNEQHETWKHFLKTKYCITKKSQMFNNIKKEKLLILSVLVTIFSDFKFISHSR